MLKTAMHPVKKDFFLWQGKSAGIMKICFEYFRRHKGKRLFTWQLTLYESTLREGAFAESKGGQSESQGRTDKHFLKRFVRRLKKPAPSPFTPKLKV